ncbi:uncharacterized protein LOC132629180 [Lycium barbarum]|uniref:uncharacterized protein LOC132629180 n=1 Tax=Lycium barbarum TaxID=112863 RepID=UPI00293EA672|nr:uncharacterized protein LOC132629180 [Lycium barbarum]
MTEPQAPNIKYFKFLNCWVENPTFFDTVQSCWEISVVGDPMWCFHQKLKRLASNLSYWSRKEFGDIYAQVKDYEVKVKKAEEDLILDNCEENRSKLHRLNAEYIKFLKMEQSILKQKTQLQWFKEGDANTSYFHALIRGIRRKLCIHKIQDEKGDWIQGEKEIAEAACDHFQKIFTGEQCKVKENYLRCIPKMISEEQNEVLKEIPETNELKAVVFSMNPQLCSRPGWLTSSLPNLISTNQSGFVKDRSITENIMLAQEVIHGIKKPNLGGNVVIKLDMAKAYDRVSWSFTNLVLRKMGFKETIIDIIWRTMANNWYSVIVNGVRHRFFHSTRGLKQGDPLAPALFILGAEVLSRMLNKLYHNHSFHGFHMAQNGPKINHLSFADDVIIFSSGKKKSLQLIMKTLSKYEKVSGQLINKTKSHFMLSPCASQFIATRVTKVTGFNQEASPITYLGFPLHVGRQRIIFFSDLVSKVVNRIRGWHSKIISHGGRAVLVRFFLQSLFIHLLSAISPPTTTMKQIQSLVSDFFWGWKADKRKYHWASWESLIFPYNEGGIGMRLISDICKAMQFKQWWVFRSKHSLWGDFLKAKYYQRANPISKKWDTGQSLVWKHMMRNKYVAEKQILWLLNSGSCCFWWDDWLDVGPLSNYRIIHNRANNIKVADFLVNGQWNK